jgi:hypothetical protein
MAETEETWKVTGKRSDMAATGPSPGNTPTRVPMSAPKKQKKMFIG